jgi:plastocyanin
MRFTALPLAAVAALGTLAGALAAQAPAPPTAPEPPAPRYRIEGRIQLLEKGRPADRQSVDPRRAAVWFEPDVRRGADPVRPQRAVMSTLRKQFSPQLLIVPVGSTVRFPNQDPILHNVFSVSGGNAFDLGLVGSGEGKSATFREAGLVRVFCNVHHAMFAHVLVVASPHYTQPAEDGRFALDGVLGGAGTLRYWHERSEPQEQRIRVPHIAPLELAVEVTLPRVPPHKNKFGKSYRRSSYE